MKINRFIKTLSFMVVLLGSSSIGYAQPAEDLPPVKKEEPVIDFTENPCPEPRQALSEIPNDLQIIQEDITRFNLCLQRAQLLTRLNDLAEENAETIDSGLDEKLQNIAGSFEPMPMPQIAIPEVPQIPELEVSEEQAEPESEEPAASLPEPPVAVIEPPKEFENWFISEIKGRNGALVATLVDDRGNIAHVKSGDVISDTKIRVTTVSQTSVKVLEDKESAKLKWKQ